MVGMWVASEVPERVERLVLLCTSALLGPREMWDARIASVGDGGMDAITGTVLERWFTPGFRQERPEVVGWVGDQLRATPSQGYVATCEAIRDMDLRDRLGTIEAPTLILAGAEDPATPPEHAERLVEGIRNSRLVVIPETAHLANIERAERVTGEIVGHLDGAR
jgi:3-oxoadipate enol-lactonase